MPHARLLEIMVFVGPSGCGKSTALRASLNQLHERLSVTTVYVTHDQVKAMTLGDRICVLLGGRLQHADTPQ